MATTLDELFAALSRLRDAARSSVRDLASERDDWRLVDRWLRAQRAARGNDDVVQESLLAVVRHIGELDARDPSGAAAWLSRIVRHKQIDEQRMRARRLRHVEPAGDEEPIDQVARDDAWQLDDDAFAQLLRIVESAIATHVATLPLPAADAMLRRIQARATLHRVLGASQTELRVALAVDDTVSNDRIHKWVERGRPVLTSALDRVEAEPESVLRLLIDRLRSAVLERRADAGVARPDRRKKTGEEEV